MINKSLLYDESVKYPLLNVDLEKLYNEYFNIEFVEFTITRLTKMFNDFKIIIRLVDSFIKAFKDKSIITEKNNQTKNKDMKKIYSEESSNFNLLD